MGEALRRQRVTCSCRPRERRDAPLFTGGRGLDPERRARPEGSARARSARSGRRASPARRQR